MFTYPVKALFNRLLPKAKIYANAKVSKSVKDKFIKQVSEIVWKYKLSSDTTNLPARDGFTEIQIFEITLKEPELGNEVLTVIDKAIPYPIFFRLRYEERVKGVAAYKRPAADGSGKWLFEEYFETGWSDVTIPATPLPVALDLKGLYEQMFMAYIDLQPRAGEALGSLVERVRVIRKHRRELRALEAKMSSEKHFNRKVELNAKVREVKEMLKSLTPSPSPQSPPTKGRGGIETINEEPTMDKLKMRSPNLVDANIDKIAALFPNCITEDRDENGILCRAVDFDLLRQELSASLVEGPQERYTLNWPGKNEAILTANAPIAKTLRPCEEESVDFENTRNIFIEGDNLDALKLLQETYLNKIKMIYIDPPYNTGNDFIYEDDFAEDTEAFLQRSNQKDKEGNRLVANTESNGRFHSDWLTMIYARLKLARNLLREDGVIFISIDDNEAHNLRKVCDEVFGESNFIAEIIWKKRSTPPNDKIIAAQHEYILCFSKNNNSVGLNLRPRSDEQIARYKNPDKHSKGPWTAGDLMANVKGGRYVASLYYPIVNPRSGQEHYPSSNGNWRFNKDKIEQLIKTNEIYFGEDDQGRPKLKRFLCDVKEGITWTTLWDFVPFNTDGSKEMAEIFGNLTTFENPKPKGLILETLRAGSLDQDIILDFFSGSATTAHAVMQLNSEDGGNRKFIMVQLPEPCDEKSEAFKAGYKTIAEIGKERIRRAGKKIKEENGEKAQALDIGFRVFKVDTSNMLDVYYTPDELKQGNLDLFKDHIKPDRRAEDLLFQVFIDWGLDLALPIAKETIDGKTVFFVDTMRSNALIACFDSGITEELVKKLAKHKPVRVVFRDDAFGSDSVKINVEQIFKLLSPGTEVKSI